MEDDDNIIGGPNRRLGLLSQALEGRTTLYLYRKGWSPISILDLQHLIYVCTTPDHESTGVLLRHSRIFGEI